MREIDCCFYCDTPYQIMSVIFIVRSSNKSADIYIDTVSNGAAKYVERLSEIGIFSEVKLVDLPQYRCNDRNVIIRRIKRTLICLCYKKIVSQFLIDNTVYHETFISSLTMVKRLLHLFFMKYHPNMKIISFDDGAGSYFNDLLINLRPHEILLWQLLLRKIDIKNITTLWLYSPALYKKLHPKTTNVLKKIPIEAHKEDNIEIFNNIFCFNKTDIINEKVCIFGIVEGSYLPEEIEEISNIYTMIYSLFAQSDVIIKKHPRDKSSPVAGYKYYEKTNIPFECLCMNTDLSDRILISFSSTAVTSPKLLFNQEPYVILLYKLVHNKRRDFTDEDRYYSQLTVQEQRYVIYYLHDSIF